MAARKLSKEKTLRLRAQLAHFVRAHGRVSFASLKAIGKDYGITPEAVRYHVAFVKKKLRVGPRKNHRWAGAGLSAALRRRARGLLELAEKIDRLEAAAKEAMR